VIGCEFPNQSQKRLAGEITPPEFMTPYPAEAVDNIPQLTYWGRVWIIQELRLSHSLDFWCAYFKSNAAILLRLMIYDAICTDLQEDKPFIPFPTRAERSCTARDSQLLSATGS
jgi:hypothetical protein